MAELDKWFNAPGLDKVEVDVEMLDFAFVEQCDDWMKLLKILQLLKSGQEGHYPELAQATESKMLQLLPLHEKKRYMALSRTATEHEILEAERDIYEWTKNAKQFEKKLVEEQPITLSSTRNQYETILNKTQCAKISQAALKFKVEGLSNVQRERRAEMERRKGNECFKANEYDAAIGYYTNSIALFAQIDVTWTNRAIAYIKKELFSFAEMDCNVALYLNPDSIKGLTRRGLARLSQGKYKEAAIDFNCALNLQSDSKELEKLLLQALERYKDSEGTDLNLNAKEELAEIATATTIHTNINICNVTEMVDLLLPIGNFSFSIKSNFESYHSENPDTISSFVRICIDDDDDEEEEENSIAVENNCNETETLASVIRVPIEFDSDSDSDSESDSGPQRAMELKELGNNLMAESQFAAALDAYNSSLSTLHSVATLNNRAQAHICLNNFKAAVEDCCKVLIEEPTNTKALFRRAVANAELHLYDQAHTDLVTLLELDPSHPSATKLIVDVVEKLEHQKQAAITMKRIEQSNQLKVLGNKAMEIGDYVSAIQHYSDAINSDESNISARSNRVLAHLKLKQFTSAIEDASFIIVNDGAPESLKRKALFRRSESYYNIAMETLSYDTDACNKFLVLASTDVNLLVAAERTRPAEELLNLINSAVEALKVSQVAVEANISSSTDEISSASTSYATKEKEVIGEDTPKKKSSTISPMKSPMLKEINRKAVPEEPPKTLYEFERCWKGLQGHKDLKIQYLTLFKKSTFKKALKEAISCDLLGSIIDILVDDACTPQLSRKIVEGLSGMPSLLLTISMLPEDNLLNLKRVFAKLRKTYNSKSNDDRNIVEELARQFGVDK